MAACQEGGPPVKSQAEVTLQQLLEKQLSTTGRLEQVDFKEATESMRCIGHASAGVASLAEFRELSLRQRQADEKAWALRDLLQSKGLSDAEIKDHFLKVAENRALSVPCTSAEKAGFKRKRYGAHPAFIQRIEVEQQQLAALERERGQRHTERAAKARKACRRAGGLTAAEQRQAAWHCAPQFRRNEPDAWRKRMLPERLLKVFASPAPPVLDMYTYLEQRQQEALSRATMSPTAVRDVLSCTGARSKSANTIEAPETESSMEECVREVSEEEIRASQLGEEDIRQLPGGKFANYAPGDPSNTLYIKNLVPGVIESDLKALFIRFQRSGGQQFVFRLMQRGRMKGQAFVTFPDVETAGQALKLVNGYNLKGKPMVIEYARGPKSPSLVRLGETTNRSLPVQISTVEDAT